MSAGTSPEQDRRRVEHCLLLALCDREAASSWLQGLHHRQLFRNSSLLPRAGPPTVSATAGTGCTAARGISHGNSGNVLWFSCLSISLYIIAGFL